MLVYSVLPKPSQAVTGADAKTLLLNALKNEGIDPSQEIQITNFTANDGDWTADVIVTSNPHSKCPIVKKRSYSNILRSFKFRLEQLIKDCDIRSPVVLREEAIIDAGALPETAGADYFCAFSIDELRNYDSTKSSEYCEKIEETELRNFSRNLPNGTWVVQFNRGESHFFMELDSYGKSIKTA